MSRTLILLGFACVVNSGERSALVHHYGKVRHAGKETRRKKSSNKDTFAGSNPNAQFLSASESD
jgi:hypothetical protein